VDGGNIGVELWYHAYLQIILFYKNVFGKKRLQD
jgi:hypothetical protein